MPNLAILWIVGGAAGAGASIWMSRLPVFMARQVPSSRWGVPVLWAVWALFFVLPGLFAAHGLLGVAQVFFLLSAVLTGVVGVRFVARF